MRFVYIVEKNNQNTNNPKNFFKILKNLVVLFLFIDITFFFIAKISYKVNYNEEVINESTYTPFSKMKWYERYNLVAHALGEIENESYTNSLEAFEESYKNNFRVFEVDFSITKDEKIVATHKWETDSTPTYEDFMNQKIKEKYTPLDLEKILNLLNENKDIYIITDFKYTDKKEIIEFQIEEIVKEAKKINPDILDRLIIQIYTQEMYEWIDEIYKFKYYVYTLYKNKDTTNQIVEFIKEKNIDVVTCEEDRLDDNLISLVNQEEKSIFVHTVNDVEKYNELMKRGISGIYTDSLNSEQILNSK